MSEADEGSRSIPIVHETVSVDKVAVQTDAVQVRTTVDEIEVLVEEVVTRGILNVSRVRVDRPVDAAPPPREEGNTTVISLVEERLVVEKRLFVIEEVHVTREPTKERVAVPVMLRSMRATIERASDPPTGNTNNG